MTGKELELRLRRIEGLLSTVARALDVDRDERDLDGEIARAYRRGYLAGHHAQRRGDPLDVEGALARRRRPRIVTLAKDAQR